MSTTSTLVGASNPSAPVNITAGDGIIVSGSDPNYTISNSLAPITSVDGSVTITDTNPGIDLSCQSGSDPVTITGSGKGGNVSGTHPNFNIEFVDNTLVLSADNSVVVNETNSTNGGKVYDLSVTSSGSTTVTSISPHILIGEPTPNNYVVEFSPQLVKFERDVEINFQYVPVANFSDPTNWFQNVTGTSVGYAGITVEQDSSQVPKNPKIVNNSGTGLFLRSRLYLQIKNVTNDNRSVDIGVCVLSPSGQVFKRDPTFVAINPANTSYGMICYECTFGLANGAKAFPYFDRGVFDFTCDIQHMRWIVE